MGLPGLSRVDHVGFTVPDLEGARAFLVDVLGCEYLYSLGPFTHEDGDWMTEHLNVHPRAVMRRNSFFRCGGQTILDVFHYEAPDPNPTPPRNSDIRAPPPRRARATSGARTPPCTSTTWTPRSPTCTSTVCGCSGSPQPAQAPTRV